MLYGTDQIAREMEPEEPEHEDRMSLGLENTWRDARVFSPHHGTPGVSGTIIEELRPNKFT